MSFQAIRPYVDTLLTSARVLQQDQDPGIFSDASEYLSESFMATAARYVSTAEAAFIAGVSDRNMNRTVDEDILPPALFKADHNRGFTRLGAALAAFYFGTEDILTGALRKRLVHELASKLLQHRDREAVLGLITPDLTTTELLVTLSSVQVDVRTFVERTRRRMAEVETARRLVSSDPEVLGGVPVFAGTRVPTETVLSSLDEGVSVDRLRAAYPFLTEEHLEAARTYAAVNPRRGRPRRPAEQPGLKSISRRIVRRAH